MTFKVSLNQNTYVVKLKSPSKFKAVQENDIMSNNFADLNDVSVSDLNANKDNYVVVYDSSLGKFTIVDPDVVLSAASTSTGPQPGLPADFEAVLDADLDNRIDLDAGNF
jgi:hypothetical protein